MIYTTRETCRACFSSKLRLILSLGEHVIPGFVPEDASHDGHKVPLELMLCEECTLVQLRHTTNPELLWRHYWYRSGTNHTMRSALREIAERATAVADLGPGDKVVDIGCNDGTLLRSYGVKDLYLLGFEPARNLLEDATKGTTRIVNDFFSFESLKAHCGADFRAKVITSISMFYDLEDPNAFVRDVKSTLDRNGLWIIQMNYLVSMLESTAFDNIGHEHLEYYSLYSLERLLARHGLEIIDVEQNDLNGGSIRAYVVPEGSQIKPLAGASERLAHMRDSERSHDLMGEAIYQSFVARVEQVRKQAVDFVRAEIEHGRKIYVYGASTRGGTILQYFGLSHREITAAAERSPHKFGLKTSGTGIPIVSEEQARAAKPEYFLILPYFFLEEFLGREKQYLSNGGHFIVPLPEFRIIGSTHREAIGT